MKVITSLRIEKKIRDDFKKYCSDNGYAMNRLLEVLMKEKMEDK